MTGSAKTQNWCLVRTAFLLLFPVAVGAQEAEVTRRSYTFLDDRLVVQVATDLPGELRVVRGERGRVEVAGRAEAGFVGFGLGGENTRQLRLTSAGGARVEYLVVVPEHVRLTVQLPAGSGSDLSPRQPTALYRWGQDQEPGEAAPLLPTAAGLGVVHRSEHIPGAIELTDLGSVRSLSVRFQGNGFRVAASRPVSVSPGTPGGGVELAVSGDPTDIVIYLPPRSAFSLRSGSRRLLTSGAGQPTTSCNGVAVQRPTADQVWFTFYPRSGMLECR